MKIHAEEAPVRGETVLETRIQSDLSLKTPLTLRIVSELVSEGLIKEEEREKFEICCDEAIKNAIVHGNGENPSRWVLARVFRDGDGWGISVEDQGAGFGEEEIQCKKDPCLVWKEEGRGIQVMEHVMDRVEYFSGGRQLVLSMKMPEIQAMAFPKGKESSRRGPLWFSEKESVLVAHMSLPSKEEAAIDAIFKSLIAALEGKNLRALVLDLTGVAYMTSHAIGRLISLYKTCLRTELCLRLTGVNPDLKQVFVATRLNSLFESYERLEEAIEAP